MSKRPVTMEEMRALQLDILDSVHAFCMERGLRYSLGGGTLLGAVRHKGYIPWDDDIDIMMPRPDYERFLREFPGTKANLSIQNYHNDPHCYLMFSKVYDNRTVLEEDIRIRNGVAIDVFAIDGLPDENGIDEYFDKLTKYNHDIICMTPYFKFSSWQCFRIFVRKILSSSRTETMSNFEKRLYSSVPKSDVIRRLNLFTRKLVCASRRDSIDNLEKLISSHNFDTSDYAGAITGEYGKKELMPASSFRNYTTLPFEGREFMAIADYDSYLTKHYGNYMQLPPEDKQHPRHAFKAWWK
ncbi:MAG: LicD family protein [Duncaniella sp.]|nr:LicD family protein [Duncaniella sp.]